MAIMSLVQRFMYYFANLFLKFCFFSKFYLAFLSTLYYTKMCRKDTFYNPLLIIYTPLKRSMAPPSIFYFIPEVLPARFADFPSGFFLPQVSAAVLRSDALQTQ